jgi:hypothetical protein
MWLIRAEGCRRVSCNAWTNACTNLVCTVRPRRRDWRACIRHLMHRPPLVMHGNSLTMHRNTYKSACRSEIKQNSNINLPVISKGFAYYQPRHVWGSPPNQEPMPSVTEKVVPNSFHAWSKRKRITPVILCTVSVQCHSMTGVFLYRLGQCFYSHH